MRRILTITDEEETRNTIIRILETKEFVMLEARQIQIGIQMAHKFNPDLILCDLDMSNLSGYSFLKKVRQDPDLSHIPFIFLTSQLQIQEVHKGIQISADDYIAKPIEASQLLAAIDTQMQSLLTEVDDDITDTLSVDCSAETLRLTDGQQDILKLFSQRKSLKAIAMEKKISLDAAILLEDISVRLSNRIKFGQKASEQITSPELLTNQDVQTFHSVEDDRLTPRQKEILKLVASGMTTKEIASSLFISVKTVETHRGQLMERLNIHDLAGLIRYAIRIGLIDLEDDSVAI
ncbi:response regulator transcription factor [Pseudanabaena mucicola]|uniref:Response regulator transcription factor n=1 Tax=Pseudanabaena mucicola FACHB-723 TaxID=2692860 RepID=A0ABR8A260_9CYAN|nr:response regulator transcription factor [Pseudanabaena mucicola]MBD2189432.1 response regulator transcription factor [Pseudanabaena mucicola FACHB-723]